MRHRNIIFISFMSLLLIGFSGCSSSDQKKGSHLYVLTELEYREKVEDAVSYTRQKDPKITIEVEYISSDEENRETELQKLRTQIMAGKGPDVYILDNMAYVTSDKAMPLFENPYKTMQSGALASLNRYMEKDSYWEESTYQKEFLNAGQYNGKQYIIPLSCEYTFLISDKNDLEYLKEKNLTEWLIEAKKTSNINLRQLMLIYNMCAGKWVQEAADYEEKEVLFDKNAWVEFYMEQLLYKREQFNQVGSGHFGAMTDITSDTQSILTVPDIKGKKLASIHAFGAVGMSSAYKNEAYEFLMLFLNDEAKTELEKDGLGTRLNGTIDIQTPVQESALDQIPVLYNIEEKQMNLLKESYRELEGAYFYTETEHVLDLKVDEATSRFDDLNADFKQWEATASELAEWAYKNYEMQIAE